MLTVTTEDTRRETEVTKAINDTKQDAKAIKPDIYNRRTLENMRAWYNTRKSRLRYDSDKLQYRKYMQKFINCR